MLRVVIYMSVGLVNGKIYLKEKEISVEKIVFLDDNKMMVFLDDDGDYEDLKFNNKFDVNFNKTILLNCEIDRFDSSKNLCIGFYELKKDFV